MEPPPSQPVTKTSKPASEPEKVKPDSSFKLKQALSETVKNSSVKEIAPVTEDKIVLQVRDSFNEEKVSSVIEEYIVKHKLETMLSVALRTHRPLVSDEEIIIEIDNKLQIEKLETIRVNLLNNLIKGLNNGFVKLSFRLFENKAGKEEKKLFTASDKFAHFCEQNPAVAELKKVFGLELE